MDDLNPDKVGQGQRVDHLIPESGPGESEVNFSVKAQRDKFLGGGFFGKIRENLSGQKKPKVEGERMPSYWRKSDKRGYEFDFQRWRKEFLKLPSGRGGGFHNTIRPAIENEGVMEIIERASMDASGVWGDDLTGKTQENVMAEKINLLFKAGKKPLIRSLLRKSLSERRSMLPALEQTFDIFSKVARLRAGEIDIREYELSLEDKVRFIVAGKMGHGTVAENVAGILEKGLIVNPKRNTSVIPAISGRIENNQEYGNYDPLTYRKGENSSTTLVYGEGATMEGFIDFNSALAEGAVRESKENGYVFTAQPELVLCETGAGKEIVLKNLPKDLRSQWEGKIFTYEELVNTSPQPLNRG